ncbi:MAG: alpha-L-rhamnosidase [Planctomycetota bacterium]|nr:alpha-L-rhamnosidase [Planctomycetota bacterium]
MRIPLTDDPFIARTLKQPFWLKGTWRSHWIGCRSAGETPFVLAFRRVFTMKKKATVRVHVSADERYELFLDGQRIGRGPERGDTNHWYYESYALPLSAGEHVLVARVWALGDAHPDQPGDKPEHLGSSVIGALAPTSQMGSRPGFILAPDAGPHEKLLGTGQSAWDVKKLDGYAFVRFHLGAQLTGAKLDLDGARYDARAIHGGGDGWEPAQTLHPGVDGARGNDRTPLHQLLPAQLPPLHHAPIKGGTVRHAAEVSAPDTRAVAVRAKDHDRRQAAEWSRWLKGGRLTIPPHTRRRAIVELDDYYCAYHGVETSGGAGARVRVHWAEALFEDAPPKDQAELERWCPRWKGRRGEVDGKHFVGMGDTFRPGGGARQVLESLWWHAGRYLEIFVETAAEPLTLHRLRLTETRYPLEADARFESSDAKLRAIEPMMLRAIQMSAHETFVDCPYYEQLMYAGDTRLECLISYALSPDARLPQKAVRLFEASRLTSGLTQSRYPCRVRQVIPTFSLWWIAMVRDAAYWRDGVPLVRAMLPGVRGVIDCFAAIRRKDGLVAGPNGWNYMDWVPAWKDGIPPDGEYGASGLINWLFVLNLGYAADLEEIGGERALAVRNRRLRDDLARVLLARYWNAKRGLLADDLKHAHFSEHTQCLALLSGCVDAEKKAAIAKNLFADKDLARTTIFFTHYLFEACRLLGRMDVFHRRLGLWHELKKLGFKTTFECPEPSRSDCHGWGAHPLFHYYASILGIRPAAPGFAKVEIAPQLAHLTRAAGRMPHPRGEIAVAFRRKGRTLTGHVTLPKGVAGVLKVNGEAVTLKDGKTVF